MRLASLALSLLLVACGDEASTCPGSGGPAWTRSFSEVFAFGITPLAGGEVVIAGFTREAADFCEGPLRPPSTQDDEGEFFVAAQFDAEGGLVWGRQFGVSGSHRGFAVAADPTGGVWLAGTCEGTIDFGGGELASAAGEEFHGGDACLVHFAADGSHLLSKLYPGLETQTVSAIAVDPAGNLYIAGQLYGSVDFGGGALASSSVGSDPYVAAFTPDGAFRWQRAFANYGQSAPSGLAASADALVLTGRNDAPIDLGSGLAELPHPNGNFGAHDNFIASLDPQGGATRWAQVFGSDAEDTVERPSLDSAGDIVCNGQFGRDLIVAGAPPLTAPTEYAQFVLKLGADGEYRWARAFAHDFFDPQWYATATPAGEVRLVGGLARPTDFGTGSIGVPCSDSECGALFIASLAPDGTTRQARMLGQVAMDIEPLVASSDADGTLLISGLFARGGPALDIGVPALRATAMDEAFVARLPPGE